MNRLFNCIKCLCLTLFIAYSSPLYAITTKLNLIADGLSQPMVVASNGANNTIYTAEKSGNIYVVNKTTGAKSLFIDLSSKIDTSGERGLLGLTFDPNHATNGYFYVNYSDKNTGHNIIERYSSSSNMYQADIASAYKIMTIEQPVNETSHKAGWIGFRPGEDKNLYVATGDGAWRQTVADPYNVSQNLQSNLGKLLRVDITKDDFSADGAKNYGIPADNMSVSDPSINPEIWAYGLRNPFRASFDSKTGDLWVGDVGFTKYDEINFLAAGTASGTNFGWPIQEGNTGVPGVAEPVLSLPVGSGSALIGGEVYRGSIPELYGMYIYSDYVKGEFGGFRYDASSNTIYDQQDFTTMWQGAFGKIMASSFGVNKQGELFITDLSGRLFEVVSVAAVPLPPSFLLFLSSILFAGLIRKTSKVYRYSFSKR